MNKNKRQILNPKIKFNKILGLPCLIKLKTPLRLQFR